MPSATSWSAPTVADDPSAAARLRGFVARTRRAPGLIGEVADEVTATHAALDELRAGLARLEALAWAGRDDTRGGVTAVGDELHALDAHLDRLDAEVTRLDAAVEAQATALHRAVAAPVRRAAAAARRDALGPAPDLRPGLSVFTLCWDHGALLEESVRSGLAILDQLPADEQGQLLVLDDASTDRSGEVGRALTAADDRVRLIQSEVNLGLALGRNTLLHAAGTTHAFQLDADNTALAEGATALYRAARHTGAALTYGTVIQVGADGRAVGVVSNEPPTPALFRSNYVDTMAVTDVAAFRGIGGWSPDPLLEHVDDWAAVHRVVEAGLLIAFVPVLVGRYRLLDTASHRSVPDPRVGARRVARVFDPTGRRQGPDAMEGVAAVAIDPAGTTLWATPAAVALDPALAPPPPPPVVVARARTQVLVVAPGGVANLGDDAITVRGLERLRAAVGPDAAIDLICDGDAPPPGCGSVRHLGPLIDLLPGLALDDLGPLDEVLARAAEQARVGRGQWHALDPSAYDAAVVLGGGSLSSAWSAGLIAPRALLTAALRHAGVVYACSGQGVGPLLGEADRRLAGALLAGAVVTSCRDEPSAVLARSLPGVDPRQVTATGDDALGLAAPADTVADADVAIAADEGHGRSPARPHLVVTVRDGAYVAEQGDDPAAGPVRRWLQAADALAADRGWDVVGVALNRQAPRPEIVTLAEVRATTTQRARWRLIDCGPDPRRLVALTASAQAVAAQSYHAALLALGAGVPAVLGAATPYYAAKAEGLAAVAGLPAALAVADAADLGPALDAVTAALDRTPRPLDPAAAAVDAWWAAVGAHLGSRPVSG